MMTNLMLENDAQYVMSQFISAEVEINGILKPVQLTTSRTGTVVSFSILVPAAEVGKLTRNVIKNASGQIMWDEVLNIDKPNKELTLANTIQSTWKRGGAS